MDRDQVTARLANACVMINEVSKALCVAIAEIKSAAELVSKPDMVQAELVFAPCETQKSAPVCAPRDEGSDCTSGARDEQEGAPSSSCVKRSRAGGWKASSKEVRLAVIAEHGNVRNGVIKKSRLNKCFGYEGHGTTFVDQLVKSGEVLEVTVGDKVVGIDYKSVLAYLKKAVRNDQA